MDPIDLAALMCSRLCHDLMSPVGAIANGLELLADEDDPTMRDHCLELVNDSAAASAAKLKFFRLAFGAAAGYGGLVDTGEARAAIAALYGRERNIQLGWMVADRELPKDLVKLLLNLAMIVGDALVRGGQLDVGVEKAGNGYEVAIRGTGPRLIVEPATRAQLEQGGSGAVEPRAAGAWLATALAARAGGRIRTAIEPDQLIIGVEFPHAA
jgi:histidine phosphotransferase ChpT